MRKLLEEQLSEDTLKLHPKLRVFIFFCPGCRSGHIIQSGVQTREGEPKEIPMWDFNGNMEAPTFYPSYLTGMPGANGTPFERKRCHSYITDGVIKYLNDCFHQYKGQEIPLPSFTDDGDLVGLPYATS